MLACLLLTTLSLQCVDAQKENATTSLEQNVSTPKRSDDPKEILLRCYPNDIKQIKENTIYFKDGSTLPFDDGQTNKNSSQLINQPDVEDQFIYPYYLGKIDYARNQDAGRIRNEAFFKKIYGHSEAEVRKNITEIVWCPKNIGQKIKVTKKNGVDKKFLAISSELDALIDQHPKYKDYLTNIGGTFVWRMINGTTRLSMHSFGMTIDINTKYSDYWQWSCKCTDEQKEISPVYANKIPHDIVAIFEKHGFIWGGKWKHFDSMHFEYRPELLATVKSNKP
jgi:hypothetical protein